MAEIKIPYPQNVLAVVASLRACMAAVVWLDGEAGGRYSIIAADPQEQLVTKHSGTWLHRAQTRTFLGDGDPLALLQTRLDATAPPALAHSSSLPFHGGAIGYFGYELGRRLQGQMPSLGDGPDMAVGLYHWAFVIDHQQQQAWLVGDVPEAAIACLREPLSTNAASWQPNGPVSVSPEFIGYARAFNRVMEYLYAGDCYQINLSRRFTAPFRGDPLGVYADFRQRAGGPFAAYFELPGGPILSGSPERFLQLRDGVVETRPIKGTRARLADPRADAAVAQALVNSAKDQAENTMIVDLLRNDLGRGCVTGSVEVPYLHQLESFATVHHLVSVVTGELSPHMKATDLLRDTLPGGSITGAPKWRAMEIIDELEGGPRGVYCGAMGYIGWDGSMDTNIAIRTLTAHSGYLDYRAGGGIVVDSRCHDEFAETESKAAAFRDLIEHTGNQSCIESA